MTLWRLLTTGLSQAKRDLTQVLMTSAVIGILFLGLAVLVAQSLDQLLRHQPMFGVAAPVLCIGVLAYTLLEIVRQQALYRLTAQMQLTQQFALYQHLVSLPLSVYRSHETRDLAQTAYLLSSSLVPLSLRLVCAAMECLPLGLGLWLWEPRVRLWLLAAAGVAVAVGYGLYRASEQARPMSAAFYTLTRSILQNIGKLRSSAAVEPLLSHWVQRQQQSEQKRRRALQWRSLASLSLVLGPAVGALMWGQQDGGTAFAVWLLCTRLALGLYAAVELTAEWGAFRNFLAKMRASKTLQRVNLSILTGAVTVDNVVFRYQPTSAPLLNGVSLVVAAGQHVAIVGVSGAGKSTLLRILAGIDQPDSGHIFYDRYDLASVDGLQAQIGVVLQESRIATGSLWSNINGFTQYPIEQAWAAARQAAIADVIEGLTMKMHTLVDENASILSRGQAQRLLLARALVHQPRILLLDEATNAIDDETQDQIFQNLKDYTVIITAQRASTLKHMDWIYVLHEGHIAEQGTYQQLIDQNGVFVRLIARQFI